jgi:hypothetical protein
MDFSSFGPDLTWSLKTAGQRAKRAKTASLESATLRCMAPEMESDSFVAAGLRGGAGNR